MKQSAKAVAEKAKGVMRAVVTMLLCYVLAISPAFPELGKTALGSADAVFESIREAALCLKQTSEQGLNQRAPPALPQRRSGSSHDDCCFAGCQTAGANPASTMASLGVFLPAPARRLSGVASMQSSSTSCNALRAIQRARGLPVIG